MYIDYKNARVADYLYLLNAQKRGGRVRLLAEIRIACLYASIRNERKK
ncbi:hypothetical protein ACIGHG_22955 [Bacillus sp. NPDC077411]